MKDGYAENHSGKKLSEMTLEELWELFPIVLTEHKPYWADRYREEVAALKNILPPLVEFYHIGSTAVNGIWAKPIIDILAVVKSESAMKQAADILRENGYIVMSENDKRISLNKGYTENGFADKVFHLHLRLFNDKDEIYFRDYLNAHYEVAKEYEKLKLRLWKKYEHDRDAYTQAKTEFVTKYTKFAKRSARVNNFQINEKGNIGMKLVKQQKIAASLTDHNADLSVLGALGIAEDAVTEFMGDLEIDGLTVKKKYGAIWVFVKTKMKFLKTVSWHDECSVTCFFSKISNATIDIDVGIKNAEGELCVYSRTELCALDMESGRIRKVSTVGVGEDLRAEAPLSDMCFSRIDAEGLPEKERVKIGFTNIDYAGHTNNKEYVRFVLNTYSVAEMVARPIREMETVYVNQSFEGDILALHKGSSGSKDVFEIRKDDKVIVKCEILRGGVQDE